MNAEINKHVFLLRFEVSPETFESQISVDAFFLVDNEDCPPWIKTEGDYLAETEIMGNTNLGRKTQGLLTGMMMRQRFNADTLKGPFLVKTEDFPLNREDMEMVIHSKHLDGSLNAFLKAAKL